MKNRIILFTDFIMIILILIVTSNTIVSTAIKNKLVSEFEKKDNNKLILEGFKLNLFAGTLESSVKLLSPDQSIVAKSIVISGFNVIDYLFNHSVYINELNFQGVTWTTANKTDTLKTKSNLAEKIQLAISNRGIESVLIGQIELNDINIFIKENFTDTVSKTSTIIAHVELYAIRAGRKFPGVNIDSFTCEILNTEMLTKDSLYTISLGNTQISSTSNAASIKNFWVTPNFGMKEFSIRSGKQTDRIELKLSSIVASGLDIKNLFLKEELLADLIQLDSAVIDIYRDKYFKWYSVRKKFVRELINDLPFKVKIDELKVNNSELTYKELMPPAKLPGGVTLSDLNATISNITNTDTGSTIFNASCNIAKKSLLKLKLDFPSNATTFYCYGQLYGLEMDELNSLFAPTSSISITSGYIESMRFRFGSNTEVIGGKFILDYRDLRMAAINPDNMDTSSLLLDIKTIIINTVVKNDSDDDAVPGTQVQRRYTRDKFITYNLIQTIVLGIKNSVK